MKFRLTVLIFLVPQFVLNPQSVQASAYGERKLAAYAYSEGDNLKDESLPSSRGEFHAQAMALGLETYAQAIGTQGIATVDTLDAFQIALDLAQAEWLKHPKIPVIGHSVEAMERLMQMEPQGPWSLEIRKAIYEFSLRLAKVHPTKRLHYSVKAAIAFAHLNTEGGEMVTPIELSERINQLLTIWIPFYELPEEIDGVFVDGHWYARAAGRFPIIFHEQEPSFTQLVGISNGYFPVKAKIPPRQAEFGLKKYLKPSRPLFEVSRDHLNGIDGICKMEAPYFNRSGTLIAINQKECRDRLINGNLLASNAMTERNFQLTSSNPHPFSDIKPLEPVPRVQPWIWGLVAGIATTAVIILNQQNRTKEQSETQVVHRSDW